MSTYQQSQEDLQRHYEEQLGFLQSSADAYDKGFDGEAKRIAHTVRVLLHDTRSSKSLLGQLGKKSLQFVDSAFPMTPDNLQPHSGLVVINAAPEGTKYEAFLDNSPYVDLAAKSFEEWWEAPVFVDLEQRSLSRKDLVLSVADQDGGSHVDPSLNEKYAALSRSNSLGWTSIQEGKAKSLGGPELAAIRQVGHEVLKTLIPGYTKQPARVSSGVIFGGMSMTIGAPSAPLFQQAMKMRKVGRNEPCPCGSSRKYKRCHGGRV